MRADILLVLSVITLSPGLLEAERPAIEAPAGPQPIGIFAGESHVGHLLRPGSASYDPGAGEYVVQGFGADMRSDRDDFYLLWKRMQGDFILRARGEFLGQGTHPHSKMGWIVRTDLEPSSACVGVVVHGDGLTALQFRRAPRAETEEVRSSVTAPDVIQLARRGTTYTMSVARFGETFALEAVSDLDLGAEVDVGLFVGSHDPNALARARFRNVRIVVPAPDDLVPYRDYIGSHLEILDVETGHRRIVHTTADSLQAPNWTSDGEALIYNRNGLLYRFDLRSEMPHVLDTGFATQNNNDHVLSFDGQMLGISHHDPQEGNRSKVYVLPTQGGTPRQVTPAGPSYLHGWSPDGRFLIYTAQREDDYDIYRIAVAGGEETRLTSEPGLDDGSEYSPDGRFIYFNSLRSGRMEIWRMKPDGSQPEQLTDDPFNNWFPHVSPKGKSVVFLSYSEDVDPSDHPFYQHVYLRLIPAAGGQPRVVAYLYGGQGTINVPSWAPDSRRLAFVSNTDRF